MAEVQKSEVYISVEVQQKMLRQALELTEKLTKELGNLKKAGANIDIVSDKEADIKKVLKTVEQIKKVREEEAKIQKSALPFGIKKLELTKLQLQKIKALAKEESDKAKAEAKAAREQERADIREQKAADKKAAADKKVIDAMERENELLSRQALTIAEIEEKNRILVRQRKNMTTATLEEAEAFQQITLEIRENQARLNEFNEDIGRHQGNVGNYASAWEGASGALGAVRDAIGNAKDAMMAFMANPAVLALTVLVATIVALGKAFLKTSGGMKLMDKASAAMSATMAQLTKAADAVAKAFGSWENFVDTIKSIGAGILSLSTAEGWANLISNISGVAEAMDETYQAELNLINSRRNLEFATLGYSSAIAKLTAEQELLQAQSDSDILSFNETKKISEQLMDVTEKLSVAKKNLAEENFKVADSELKLKQAAKLSAAELLPFYQAQVEAKNELQAADSELTQTLFDNMEKIGMRRMDEVDQDLDFIFKAFNLRKEVAAKAIELETTTSNERKRILAELQTENAVQAQNELELIQQFAKKKIDLDALLAESDGKKVAQMVKDTEITERMGIRLLELYDEQKANAVEFSELQTTISEKEKEASQKKYDDAIILFEQENELRALKLEQETLTEDELARLAIERETALLEEKLRLATEYGVNISDIERQLLEQQISNNNAILNDTKKAESDKKKLRGLAADNALALMTTVLGAESKAGKVSVAIQKGVALSGAIMDAKAAVLKAWASAPFPANLPAVATTILSTAPLVSAISSFGGAAIGAVGSLTGGGGSSTPTPSAAATPTPTPQLGQAVGVTPAQDNAAIQSTSNVVVQQVPVLILSDVREATATAEAIEVQSSGA